MKILVLDDHALFREGLRYVLAALDSTVEVIEASGVEQALAEVERISDLRLVLLDLSLPQGNGFDVLERFSTHYPHIPVIVLSASDNRSDVTQAMSKGARGYIPKSSSGEAMRNAIKLVLAGEIYVPYVIMKADDSAQKLETPQFSPRQLDVMALVIEGCSNKKIADSLGLSESTVKMHISAIFQKLGVRSRTKAIAEIHKRQITLKPT